MNRKELLLSVLLALGLFITLVSRTMFAVEVRAQHRLPEADRQSLITIENEWLHHEHDGARLESILASDFVHPVPTGDFLTKAQHIYYSQKFLPPANLTNRFGELKVRVFGDVGIVNGIVITSDEHGTDVGKSIFTDVFVFRDGRWQAVNAQENRVERSQAVK